MTDFFSELEGHLHDAARRRARGRWAPVVAPRMAYAVAVAALILAVFGFLGTIDAERDPEVVAPKPAPTATAAPDDRDCERPPDAVLDRFAVLRREPEAADRAPRSVTARLAQDFPGVGMPARVWPEAGRLAREVDGKRFWLFPVLLGKTCEPPLFETDVPVDRLREPGLCWVYVDDETNMAICHPLSELEEPRTMVMGEGEDPYVSALVPDGTKPVAIDGSRTVDGTTEGNVLYAKGASDIGDATAEAEPDPTCGTPALTREEPAPELLETVPVFRQGSLRMPERRWRQALAGQPVVANVRHARGFGTYAGMEILGVAYTPVNEHCGVDGAPAEAGACLIAAVGGEYFAHCFTASRIFDGRALIHDSDAGLAYALVPAGTRAATYSGQTMDIEGNFAHLVTGKAGARMTITR